MVDISVMESYLNDKVAKENDIVEIVGDAVIEEKDNKKDYEYPCCSKWE